MVMALSEACGLWIEQRVKEELESKGDTGISLREIGRTVAAEVEKYFEAKVDPGTIFQKARRIDSDTNVSPTEKAETTVGSGGDSGDSKARQEVVKEVVKEVVNGVPVREAARIVAERTLRNEASIRQAYYRSEAQYAGAMQLAITAISYLERIKEDDPERKNAIHYVKTWLEKSKA